MDKKKEELAIQRLRAFAPDPSEPYYVCYSGGKDSDAVHILCELAGVPYELHHNHTTVDAPETVYYVRSTPGVIIEYPEITMWKLIEKKKFPPTRLARYCCDHLKERGGRGRLKVTGVRASESVNRKKTAGLVKILGAEKHVLKIADGTNYEETAKGGIVYHYDDPDSIRVTRSCQKIGSTMINPIIDWTEDDVWEFLLFYGCTGNPLYSCGWKRVGCVGCPLQSSKGMKRDFRHYPKIRANYVRAFDRMLKARTDSNLPPVTSWVDGEAVMKWWVGDDPMQLSFFDGDDYY